MRKKSGTFKNAIREGGFSSTAYKAKRADNVKMTLLNIKGHYQRLTNTAYKARHALYANR